MSQYRRPLTASEFATALENAGVVQPGDRLRRIVIDANGETGLVTIYLERLGDDRLIDVIPSMAGIRVVYQDPPPRTVAEAESA